VASTTSLKERRSKLAADPARANDPLVPEVDTASTEAAMHAPRPEEGEELHTANQMPMASLTFVEMHKALSDLHVVSVFLAEYGIPQSPRIDSGWKGKSSLFPIGARRLTYFSIFLVDLVGRDKVHGR
jgi:hypothetical protein